MGQVLAVSVSLWFSFARGNAMEIIDFARSQWLEASIWFQGVR
jgi:hypothetical protein